MQLQQKIVPIHGWVTKFRLVQIFLLQILIFMTSKLTLLTLNTGGLIGNSLKTNAVFEQVKHGDIVILQETHFTTVMQTKYFENVFEKTFVIIFLLGTEKYQGLAVLINRRLNCSVFKQEDIIRGRAIGVVCKIDGKVFLLQGIYAPSKKQIRPRFFEKLFTEIDKFCNSFDECIVMGDFNFVESKELDRSSNTKFAETGILEFQRLKHKINIDDTYRYKFPHGKEYSFYSGNYSSQSRIDRIYLSMNLCVDTISITHTPMTFTSHNLVSVVCKLRCTKIKIGPGYWCMNTLLLETNEKVQTAILNLINAFWEENEHVEGLDYLVAWDDFKCKVSQVCNKLGKEIARSKRQHKASIEYNIKEIKQKLGVFPKSKMLKDELKSALQQLKKLEEEEIKKRLHLTHYAEIASDRHTMLTSKMMQKRSAEDRLVISIKNAQGVEFEGQQEVMDEISKQYANIFKSEGQIANDVQKFANIKLRQIDNADKDSLDGDIRFEEVKSAIKSLDKKKTPG